jgi:hypothetical protein
LVLAHGSTGKIEASTTRRPCTPLTRPWVSMTQSAFRYAEPALDSARTLGRNGLPI